jgi:peroxiredoxin
LKIVAEWSKHAQRGCALLLEFGVAEMAAGRGWRRVVFAGIAFGLVITAGKSVDAAKFNRKVDVGRPAPIWKNLAGVDGRKHSLSDYKGAKVLVIAFMCNQCEVSQIYEDRFMAFVKEFSAHKVALVGISCSLLPPDQLDKMTERAKKRKFNFDYLTDPSQQVGKDYGATVTPQMFVLDQSRNIAYMGRFDDSMYADDVHRRFVEDAVRAILAGKQSDPSETRASGCAIEYAKPNYLHEGGNGE